MHDVVLDVAERSLRLSTVPAVESKVLKDARIHVSERASEQVLNGTSAHIRLFSALPRYGRFTQRGKI